MKACQLHYILFTLMSFFNAIAMEEKITLKPEFDLVIGVLKSYHLMEQESASALQSLSKISILNNDLLLEPNLSERTKEDITLFENLTNGVIQELNKNAIHPKLYQCIYKSFSGVAFFVDSLQNKAETESIIKGYIKSYHLTLGEFACLFNRINQRSINLIQHNEKN